MATNPSIGSIRTDAYTRMYNHLTNDTYGISTDNVYPASNDKQVQSDGYPQVIVGVTVDSSGDTMGSGINRATVIYNIVVKDNSAKGVRDIMDEVHNSIVSNLEQFSNDSYHPVQDDFYEEEPDTAIATNEKIHSITGSYTFDFRGS